MACIRGIQLRDVSKRSYYLEGDLRYRPTASNLGPIETVHDWTLAINNRNAVGVMYIDFKRTFDSVSHVKLLSKLQYYVRTYVLLLQTEQRRLSVGLSLTVVSPAKPLNRLRNHSRLDVWDVDSVGVHIGATWRIRLNRPCASAMRSIFLSNYFDQLS